LKTFDEARKQMPKGAPAQAAESIKAEVRGDQIVLELDTAKALGLVLGGPVQQSRQAARRSQCTNNLKQIGLAMHNYHDKHGSFPPAFRAGQDGKPLLSWRVLILPFLEQQQLYSEFHLDEPWDSPHNKALISRMPPVYACPEGKPSLFTEGKTTYLTPRSPSTMFPGDKGVKIQEVTDGTSNTIFTLDAGDASAVIWTKPDDWDVPNEPALKALLGHHTGGVEAGFTDGSVRFIRETVKSRVLHDLFTRGGGEVINYDDF
jgi:hypothetical protein